MSIGPAHRAEVATEAALHGKSSDPRDWITRHHLAARAYDDAVAAHPRDPKAMRAKAIGDKHRRIAKLIEDWSHAAPSVAPKIQQQILSMQHAIGIELKTLKGAPTR